VRHSEGQRERRIERDEFTGYLWHELRGAEHATGLAGGLTCVCSPPLDSVKWAAGELGKI